MNKASIISFFKKKAIGKIDGDTFEFLSHAKTYVSSDIFSRGLIFITIPIFTRLLLPNEYGILAIFTAFIYIFSIILSLGSRITITRYYYDKTNNFSDFLGSSILFLIGFNIIVFFIIFIFRESVSSFLNIDTKLILFALFISTFNAFFQAYLAYLQASKQSKKVASLNIVKQVLFQGLAIFLVVILQNNKYIGKVYAYFFISFIYFGYALFQLHLISKLSFSLKYIKALLLFGVPVVFHLLAGYILSYFDLIIINQLVGQKATGLYSFAYQIGIAIDIIAMGMARSWTPMFYERLNSSDYLSINKIAHKYANIVYVIAMGLILFSREIVMIMADEKYYPALPIIPIIVISYVVLFLNKLYIDYTFYRKKTYLISIFTTIAALTNIGLNYLLIPKYGYLVAAYTTLIAFSILLFLNYINVRFILKEKHIIPLKTILPNFFLVFFLGIGFPVVSKQIYNGWVLLLVKLIVLTTFIYYLFFKPKKII